MSTISLILKIPLAGIVAAGELRCIGSQLHLKNKFGSGYRLVVQLTDDEASDSFILSEVSSLAVRVLRTGRCFYLFDLRLCLAFFPRHS